MKELTAGPNEAGQRLDKLLAKLLPQAPASFIHKMLRKKNITCGGRKCEGSHIVQEGDVIRIWFSEETFARFSGENARETDGPPADGPCLDRARIVYQDRDVLLYDKPAGVLSQKAAVSDVSLNEMLTAFLLREGELSPEQLQTFRPAFCNRLDRNTSGLAAAGKTLKGLQCLSRLFRERSMRKEYLCVVEGIIEEPGEFSGVLFKDEASNRVRILDGGGPGMGKGSAVRTAARPLRTEGGRTLLAVELITGKTHQIRAQMAALGHPVCGDPKYGKGRPGRDRQLLHSWRLTMPEDVPELPELSGRTFTAPAPQALKQMMRGYAWEDAGPAG